MATKPLITYTGNEKLFKELESLISSSLSSESVEWNRHLGPLRNVHLDADYVSFDRDIINGNRESLIKRHYLHTFWTDCSDSDEYKNTVKQQIMLWMADLKDKSQWDWMIVVVEDNSRKTPAKTTSKLLKSTIWDKIRNDFPVKSIERVCTFVRPSRTDGRSSSFEAFMAAFRTALLHALNREIIFYEERLREKREKRNQPGWSFVDFYFMQEQLAFLFENLTIFEDSLVQYDELDALLTQFVINAAHEREYPQWLHKLTECKTSWRALFIGSVKTVKTRGDPEITAFNGSLLDLRNKLLVRICNLLMLMCKPWEMAQRALPYIQNAQVELRTLGGNLSCPGAIDAWALAGFLEILKVTERYNDSTQMESYSLHTAQLWAHARLKMKALGTLCGLMPQSTPTSEQLHAVVNITGGLGDDPRSSENELSPCRRISEALSSKEAFMRHYKDICEIAMGTFKHVGRLRNARLIGKDLAEFYLDKNEPQMAVQFLQDLLKMYLIERWTPLSIETQKQLLKCYELLSYDLLYLHTVLTLATNPALDQRERIQYFDNVLATKDRLAKSMRNKQNLTFAFAGILTLDNVEVESDTRIFTLNSNIALKVTITSKLLAEIKIRKILVPCVKLEEDVQVMSTPKKTALLASGERRPAPKLAVQQIPQYNSIGLVCSNQHQVLSRQDSSSPGSPSSQDIIRVKSETHFVAKNLYLAPGSNTLTLPFTTNQSGSYETKQIVIEWDHLGLVEELDNSLLKAKIDIVQEKPSILFEMPAHDLLAGLDQSLSLTVKAGSEEIPNGSSIKLNTGVSTLNFESESIIIDEAITPFKTKSFEFKIRCNFHDQWTSKGLIQDVEAVADWDETVKTSMKLRFSPPFVTTHRLHACNAAKFLQLEVKGNSLLYFNVSNPELKCKPGLKASLLTDVQPFKVNSSFPTSYVWRMESDDALVEPTDVKFTLDFQCDDNPQIQSQYSACFKLDSLQTLYTIHATVEPESHGHCKVDAICKLNIRIVRVQPDTKGGEMHIEIIADPAMWSLLGKNTETFTIKNAEYTSSIEMKPLVRGFLPVPQVHLTRYRKPDTNDELAKETLELLQPGQIYNWSRAAQAHVPTGAHVDGR